MHGQQNIKKIYIYIFW